MKLNLIIWVITFCLISILALAGYGGHQLYTRSERLDMVAALQADNANMEMKMVFLENNDWSLIIEQLPPIIQDELALLNEMIYSEMIKKYGG